MTPTRASGRRFAVLGTYDGPLMGTLLASLRAHAAVPAALILDSQAMTEKEKRIHEERTAGELPWVPLHQDAAGIPGYFVGSHRDASTVALMQSLDLDFLINGGTPRILDQRVLDAVPLGVINSHPGRLPDYRGCTCPEWAVYNDDPICATVHRMSLAIDEGPVLFVEPIAVPRPCTYQQMRVAVYRQSMDALARAARDLQTGAVGEQHFVAQGDGIYRKPIDEERMAEVIRKLESGRYAAGSVTAR